MSKAIWVLEWSVCGQWHHSCYCGEHKDAILRNVKMTIGAFPIRDSYRFRKYIPAKAKKAKVDR